jgi:hypothetical protein
LLDTKLIEVRDLHEDEIHLVLKYWFHSPPGFIKSMGVDFSKMPNESDMEKNLVVKLSENKKLKESKLNALTILYNKKPVGFHTINPLIEGESGIFHAHIWEEKMRRRGLGLKTYPLACRIFLDRFELKRILFKTPSKNIGPIRVKEKLGIRCIGEELISFGIYQKDTPAHVYEWTRAEIESLT